MQPLADDIDVALWQVDEAGQRVLDDRLGDPVRYGFAGEHQKIPGHRVACFAIEISEVLVQWMSPPTAI